MCFLSLDYSPCRSCQHVSNIRFFCYINTMKCYRLITLCQPRVFHGALTWHHTELMIRAFSFLAASTIEVIFHSCILHTTNTILNICYLEYAIQIITTQGLAEKMKKIPNHLSTAGAQAGCVNQRKLSSCQRCSISKGILSSISPLINQCI